MGQPMIQCGGRPGTFFNDPDYEGYGVKLMGGYCFENVESDTNQFRLAYRSPGHNSAYYDQETGRYFLIFHTRFAGSGESFKVRVHQMAMNAEGWPVVLPQRYAGETLKAPEAEERTGLYKVILHGRDINKTEHSSVLVTLNKDGTATGDVNGVWSCDENGAFQCELDGVSYTGEDSEGFWFRRNIKDLTNPVTVVYLKDSPEVSRLAAVNHRNGWKVILTTLLVVALFVYMILYKNGIL